MLAVMTTPSLYFNPRSYKRSDLEAARGYDKNLADFNPRSYKRSDGFFNFEWSLPHLISIHAPTRGATSSSFEKMVTCKISIHAPTRGATGDMDMDVVEGC